MSATSPRHAFAMKVVESAHEAGLSGSALGAALINVLATMYSSRAAGDADRYAALVEETVRALRSFPGAPPPAADPGRLLSDEELVAFEALVRAAIRWTDTPNAKVVSAFHLIMAELRRLRASGKA